MRVRLLRCTVVFALLLAGSHPVGAACWKVGRDTLDCDGPCRFWDGTTGGEIRGGIVLAMRSPSVVAGDTVCVWPGSISGGYDGRFDMKSGVVLLAYGYPDSVVVITGSAGGTAGVTMVNCSEATVVEGFHITWNSQSTGIGGAFSVLASSGVIRNNVIENCRAGLGSGVYCQLSDVLIESNLFLNNRCQAGGGVIAVSGGSPQIVGNTLYGSLTSFGYEGSAVYSTGADPIIDRNIVAASEGAPAVYCAAANHPVVTCNLFWDNEFGPFAGTCIDSSGTSGNLTADPLLCDPQGGDFGVCLDSPVLAGPPCGRIGYVSPWGDCAPCQPTAVDPVLVRASWGALKAAYR